VKNNKKAVLLYLPVIHRGYIEFLSNHSDCDVFAITTEFAETMSELYPDEVSLRSLVRDPRSLSSDQLRGVLQQYFGVHNPVLVFDEKGLLRLAEYDMVVMPNEEICHFLHQTHGFGWKEVTFELTFLRWDMPTALSRMEDVEHGSISVSELQELGFFHFLKETEELAERSSDWWRQVGAVLVKDGKQVLSAWNQHLPHELAPYFAGDPRSNFNAGEHIEISTAIHAEAAIIGRAAGIEDLSVKGAELFITTFPCPGCANLIAVSGIKRIYFVEGYSIASAKEILEEFGVEIIRIVE
jgi:dCMP deaminase